MEKKINRVITAALLISLLTLAFGVQIVLYTSTERGFNVGSSSLGNWSLDEIMKWSESARSVDGSVELVIGVKNSRSDSYAELTRIAEDNGGKIVRKVANREMTVAYVVKVPLNAIARFVNAVETTSLARYIEPNVSGKVLSVPNDPYWSQQWGPQRAQVDWAWNTTVGDNSTLVAIIDYGINYNHSDLMANYAPLGYDWIDLDDYPMDTEGHGTNVAGVIAAKLNNSAGIAGIAQVRIMAERAFGAGADQVDRIANGIYHATDKGANIINISWGTQFNSSTLYLAVKYAYEAGVLLVAAGGNGEWSMLQYERPYPAGYEEVICVTGTTVINNEEQIVERYEGEDYDPQWGPWVDLAAPAINISTTALNGTYISVDGSSFAAPFVSGVAALVWSRFPYMTRDQVRIQLQHTADDMTPRLNIPPGWDMWTGYGRVNARRAVNESEIPTIQETINTMNPNGSMVVANGIYNETVVVNKTVSIFGQTWNGTIIDGGGSGNVFTVTAPNVTIANLTIRDSGPEGAGIALSASSNMIHGNNIVNNGLGINASLSANNTIYHNNFINNTQHAISSNSPNTWDNGGYPSGGNYWDDYTGEDTNGDGIGDTSYVINTNNQDGYPLMNSYPSIHSVMVQNATQNKTIVGQGWSTLVHVDLANTGHFNETFDVHVKANTTSIASETVTIRSESSLTITLAASTSGLVKGNYVLNVSATPIPGEFNTSDNAYIIGSVRIAHVADITGSITNIPDGKVDIRDLALVAKHINHVPPHNHTLGSVDYIACFNSDITTNATGPTVGVPNNIVDTQDITLMASHYGEQDP